MENEELETTNSQNGTEATENATEETVENTETEGVDLEAEVKKATATLYARTKKAEQKAKELEAKLANNSNQSATPELDNPTIARIYGIHEDDIEEILDLAKFKKLSVAETLKLSAAKAILAEKAEFRKTAEMSNTTNARRGATKTSGEELVKKLSKGDVPEDRESAEELFWARRGGRR